MWFNKIAYVGVLFVTPILIKLRIFETSILIKLRMFEKWLEKVNFSVHAL